MGRKDESRSTPRAKVFLTLTNRQIYGITFLSRTEGAVWAPFGAVEIEGGRVWFPSIQIIWIDRKKRAYVTGEGCFWEVGMAGK
jgi:hypothetical protein